MLDDDAAFNLGQALGDAILACFEAVAKVDGTTVQETIDDWVSAYVARRILEADE